MKYLLVIDDKRIRKDAFAQAEKLIKKIDRLEADLESFHIQDQRLFSNWHDLSFRKEREMISDRHEEYRKLGKFHNSIIAIAQLKDISLAAAFIILRKEEDEYARGNEAQRIKIEEARKQREEFIRREMEKEFGFGADFDDNEDEDDDNDLGNDFEDEESLPPPDPRGQAELNTIRQMRDKKLHQICRDHDGAFGILFTIFQFARADEDYALFLRVWDQVPHKHQVSFGKEFSAQTGDSIKKFIDELRQHLAQKSSTHSERSDDHDGEHDGFNDDFVGGRSSHKSASKKLKPEEREGIKLLYHKLVRHLHPDLQADGRGQTHWQKKIWNRVQNAKLSLNRASSAIET